LPVDALHARQRAATAAGTRRRWSVDMPSFYHGSRIAAWCVLTNVDGDA